MGKTRSKADGRQAEELALFCHTLQMTNKELHETSPVPFDTLLAAFAPNFLIASPNARVADNTKAVKDLVLKAKSDEVSLAVSQRLQILVKRLTVAELQLAGKDNFYQVEQRLAVVNSSLNKIMKRLG